MGHFSIKNRSLFAFYFHIRPNVNVGISSVDDATCSIMFVYPFRTFDEHFTWTVLPLLTKAIRYRKFPVTNSQKKWPPDKCLEHVT